MSKINPPIAQKEETILEAHNHKRTDNYFWMRLSDEQKNAAKPEAQTQKVLDYLNAENDYTKAILKPTEQLQETLYNEIVGRLQKDDESVPYFKNQYWYYSKFEAGKEYPIFCRKKESLENAEEVFLDVNKLAENHSFYAVGAISISPNNKIAAFAEDTVSRRVYTIRFLDLETGNFLEDKIENASASGAWANDNQSYFYTSKNTVSLLSEKIWMHKLATLQSEDVLKYHEKDPSYYIGVDKSKSGKYIQIYTMSTLTTQYQILNADQPNDNFKAFTTRENDHKYYIEHFENKFYVLSNWNAINFRLLETNENETEKTNWKELIAEKPNVLLQNMDVFENHLVISERSNASTQIKVIEQNTKKEFYLPFDEATYYIYTNANYEFKTNTLRFSYSSLTTPNTIYDYNMNTGEQELKKRSKVVGGHNPANYNSERLWATAKDGTKIPISLVYKKGFEKNGKAPMLLYSYGSYGHSTDPQFSSVRLSLLDRGFVYAIAHIRGGQEMGRTWYLDGKLLKKQNTFTDFIDVADFLIDNNYSSSKHLYAYGGSAGGLLMGAVANLAPEKFNGIIAAVPFVDVVSTMMDETIPLTTNEFDEWGNPKNEEYYNYMLNYSPYDNIKEKKYPNILITTGYWDSQVQYWEPAKWIAKLRDLNTSENLLLLNCNMETGHGGASGRFKVHKESALRFAYLLMLEEKNNS